MMVRGAVGQASAAPVEQQGWLVGAGSGSSGSEPGGQHGAQLGAGEGDVAEFASVAAFASDPQGAFAGGECDIGQVEPDDLADA